MLTRSKAPSGSMMPMSPAITASGGAGCGVSIRDGPATNVPAGLSTPAFRCVPPTSIASVSGSSDLAATLASIGRAQGSSASPSGPPAGVTVGSGEPPTLAASFFIAEGFPARVPASGDGTQFGAARDGAGDVACLCRGFLHDSAQLPQEAEPGLRALDEDAPPIQRIVLAADQVELDQPIERTGHGGLGDVELGR